MKKLTICLLAFVLGISSAAALSPLEIEETLLNEQAKSAPLPELSPEQKAALDKNLPLAAKVMETNNQQKLDPALLGLALETGVAKVMAARKDEQTGESALTSMEQRAVFVAIQRLLPAEYLDEATTYAEYSKYYPVDNWTEFNPILQQAQELVLQAVEDIANEKENYQSIWLEAISG